MGRSRRSILAAAVLLGCAAWSPAQDQVEAGIRELFNASRSDSVRASSDRELARFEHLFAATLDLRKDLSSLRSKWQRLGFEVHVFEGGVVVIAEHPEQRRGRGFFVIDRDATSGLFVQAPHRLDDRSTGQLALDLLRVGAAVVGISTVQRELVDLAHTDSCELSSATAAFARQAPEGTVLQLHGYAAASHADLSAFDGVLSTSTRTSPHPDLSAAQTCLATRLEMRLAVFPTDAAELGGTTNSQARVARRHGLHFRHLELNEAARARLRGNPGLLEPLIRCFAEVQK